MSNKMKVELLEIFGNDDMVATAARVSYGKEASNYTVEQNAKLIKYDNLPYLCRKAVV